MDPLTQQLIQRQLVQGQTPPQAGMPGPTPPQGPQASMPGPVPPTPPNPHPHLGSEAQRFANTQAIQNAYRGDWSPNPVLLQASLSK